MKARPISGLYAVTPDLSGSELVDAVAACLRGGAKIIQYRNKQTVTQSSTDYLAVQPQLRELSARCHAANALFIINDDPGLAAALDADGVHIGTADASLTEARALLGPDKIIGVSCYNRLDLACQAQSQGADYVAFGSFFGSSVKPDAVHAPLELIGEAKRALNIPVVAIGGITLENAPLLIQAGVDAVAVISALFSNVDIAATAEKFNQLFER